VDIKIEKKVEKRDWGGSSFWSNVGGFVGSRRRDHEKAIKIYHQKRSILKKEI